MLFLMCQFHVWRTLVLIGLAVFLLGQLRVGSCQFNEVSPSVEEVRFQEAAQKRHAELKAAFAGGTHRQASCACYEVEHPFPPYYQPLCICERICYNGKQLVAPGALHCRAATEAVRGGPMTPVSCQAPAKRWEGALSSVISQNFRGGIPPMEDQWLGSRQAVEWWAGTTYLHELSQDATNIAHFLGRVMQVLLANNSTLEALTTRVDRIAFPRHPDVVQRMRRQGSDGFHATILATLIRTVLTPLYGSGLKWAQSLSTHRVLGDLPLGPGVVEFELAFVKASEERPLCFDKVILPATLKAISYIGGQRVADRFHTALRMQLSVQPSIPTGRVRLLWVRRDPLKTKGRRSFLPESAAALRAICERLDFEIREVDFDGMPFREQFVAVQEADVFLSMHGAGLTNPTTFGRHQSVVVEVMPFHVFHPMYCLKAAGSGITYMLHQCRQGTPQPLDAVFSTTGLLACEEDVKCKHFYMHDRHVELTPADLADMEMLLKLAKTVALDARVSAAAAGRKLGAQYPSLCKGNKKLRDCRQTLVRSALVDRNLDCILEGDC